MGRKKAVAETSEEAGVVDAPPQMSLVATYQIGDRQLSLSAGRSKVVDVKFVGTQVPLTEAEVAAGKMPTSSTQDFRLDSDDDRAALKAAAINFYGEDDIDVLYDFIAAFESQVNIFFG